MTTLTTIMYWVGLKQSPENKAISDLVKNGYKSKMVGRGTTLVDVDEVMRDENFLAFRKRAKKLVRNRTN